jgi:hypothetical protein
MKAPCGELCAGSGRNKWKLVAKVKFSGEVDGAGTAHGLLKLSLTMKRKFHFDDFDIVVTPGVFKETAPFDFPIAQDPANDGSWGQNLNITSTDGQALAGTGSAMLGNGRVIDNMDGRGKYDPGRDTSKLSLKGLGGAKIKFKDLVADGITQMLVGGTVKYKILGQKRETSLTSSCFP